MKKLTLLNHAIGLALSSLALAAAAQSSGSAGSGSTGSGAETTTNKSGSATSGGNSGAAMYPNSGAGTSSGTTSGSGMGSANRSGYGSDSSSTSGSGSSYYNDGTPSYSWIPYTSYGYVGVNLGTSDYDTPCVSGYSCDNPNFAGKIYTGGLLSRLIGLEIGYVNVGNADRNGGRQKAQGVNVSLVGNIPLGQSFNIFGKVGSTYGWTETTAAPGVANYQTGDKDGFGLSYGAGLGFDINKKNQVVVEWDRQRFKFVNGRDDVDMYTVGWKYKF